MTVLTTAISDSSGNLHVKLKALLPAILKRFEAIAALVTTTTHSDIFRTLEDSGAYISTDQSDFYSIGRHRRESLRLGLEKTSSEAFVFMDIDHLMRWLEIDPAALDQILEAIGASDCTVIGRGPRSFASLPDRLRETETIVNRIYKLITGDEWDLMMAARGLSRRAAEVIVNHSVVDTIGNDVEWPLLCRKRKLSLQYIEAEGLTYRTNLDYALDQDDSLDHDPQAWATRVLIAKQHVDAMLPYME